MHLFSLNRRLHAVLATVATVVAGVLSVTPAHAAVLKTGALSTGACDNAALGQPFAQWGDTNEYELAPGGAFGGGQTSWTLTGGATVTAGGDTFNAGGATSPSSLLLPAGASAQSPSTCVNLSYPTFRLFARAADPGATVTVSVVYQGPSSGVLAIPVGTLTPSGTWQPTQSMATGSGLPALLTGNSDVALRFTASGGRAQIDDVFIDPRMSK